MDGRLCWVVEMTAKEKDVSYYTRKIWVDKERWLPLMEERYAKSGKLLKTTKFDEIVRIEGRWYPMKMTFKDMLQRGGGTEYIVDSIDFDVEISDHMFTKAALRE
jgi:outer membrane lipoprotein-sorting protein